MWRPLSLALVTACAAEPDRVVLVGMDGLDRLQLERMVRDGELPTFARIMAEGLVADLAITEPILSPILWTTMASGYRGEVHGIGGWTTGPGGQAYTSADVRTWRLWDVAAGQRVPVLVLGWLMSWPATPVPGAMITDRFVWSFPMNKDPDEESVAWSREEADATPALVYPSSLDASVWLPEPDADHPLTYQVAEYGTAFHPYTRDETHTRAFEALWPETRARLGLLYLAGADQVSHLYWPFLDSRSRGLMRSDPEARMKAAAADRGQRGGRRAYPWVDAPINGEELAEGARWVPDYYRFLDSLLTRVLAVIDPSDTTLIVCSDHGFQASSARPVLGGGHREPAVFLAWGGRTRAGAEAADLHVFDVAPTLYALAGLPAARDMPGRARGDLFDLQPAAPVDSWVLPRAAVDPGTAEDPGQRRLLEQLEALGYVDDDGAPIMGASRGAQE